MTLSLQTTPPPTKLKLVYGYKIKPATVPTPEAQTRGPVPRSLPSPSEIPGKAATAWWTGYETITRREIEEVVTTATSNAQRSGILASRPPRSCRPSPHRPGIGTKEQPLRTPLSVPAHSSGTARPWCIPKAGATPDILKRGRALRHPALPPGTWLCTDSGAVWKEGHHSRSVHWNHFPWSDVQSRVDWKTVKPRILRWEWNVSAYQHGNLSHLFRQKRSLLGPSPSPVKQSGLCIVRSNPKDN